MKYTRLTKEQFGELEKEFITFLATQSITAEEWRDIKEKKPEVAEQELDVFSDLVWERALSKAEYLQSMAKDQLFLFHIAEDEMKLIAIKVNDPERDITTTEGFEWLQKNLMSDAVVIFKATKPYTEDRNQDVFDLIQQGAYITDGTVYEAVKPVVE